MESAPGPAVRRPGRRVLSGAEIAAIERILARFSGLRVLVVGDVMLDEYQSGAVTRISPEAPVPIVRVDEVRHELGGAGNVARNLLCLGVQVDLVGIVGADREAGVLRRRLAELGLDAGGVVESPSRPTTHKLRVVARAQQMLRLDREDESPLAAEERTELEARIFDRIAACDAVVLVDYDKGLFAEGLARTIIAAGRARGIPVAADPKRELQRFRGATLVKPNLAEACAAVGGRGDDFESRCRLVEKLRFELAGADIVVTRGGEGVTALGGAGRAFDVPTRRLPVYDVQGAGDTSMAALVACRSAGASLFEACVVANAAAAIAVSKVGTAAPTRAELQAGLAEAVALATSPAVARSAEFAVESAAEPAIEHEPTSENA